MSDCTGESAATQPASGTRLHRRQVLKLLAAAAAAGMTGRAAAATKRAPNFIVVMCDDLGYGDIQATGGHTIRTPHLNRMAAEGLVLTDFYAAANLCTPSRAGFLTGRYPIRTGLARGVIMQNDSRGLQPAEVTIAEALKPDYASALIGKWHLGHVAPYWPPTRQGFDLFFGLPYSHDMLPLSLYESNAAGVELTKEDVDYPRLQQRFYSRAEQFITQQRARPFFLNLALSAPHLPNFPAADHEGHSNAGLYGDTVEEVDALSGKLMALLKELEIDRDTLLIFTSDNGPWFEGSAGVLRQRKGGGAYDGGYRVPCIAHWPGTIPAGKKSSAIAMSTDLLPTFCALAGRSLPQDVMIDGRDISAVLTRMAVSPHDQLVLFDNEDVVGIRTQRWKYVAADYFRGYHMDIQTRGYPQLYDIQADPTESYSLAAREPVVLKDMQARLQRAREMFAPLRSEARSGIFTVPEPQVVPKVFRE